MKLRSYISNFDWLFFIFIFFLVAISLAEIYSIALGQGDASLGNFKRQAMFAVFGFGLFFFLSFIDYHHWRNFAGYLYIGSIILLIAVLIFGQFARGTKGWIYIGPVNIQPVEFAKVVLLMVFARYFGAIEGKEKNLRSFLISIAILLPFFVLVALQPDFGSAMVLAAIWGSMIIAASFPKKYFIFLAVAAMIIFSASWAFYFKDYQKERILSFTGIKKDSLNSGYNVEQSMIAVGSGRWLGRGIGFGSQSQLKFLPESHNDFIFAVIAEELGILGTGAVLALFIAIIFRIFRALKRVGGGFGSFFLIGAAFLIFIEMFVNIGMNIGLVPVVGISLPFLSYGGSGLVAKLALAGIVQNIILRSRLAYKA